MYDAKGRADKEQILDDHILLVQKLAHQLKPSCRRILTLTI